jgi:hypothetical protein
LALAMADHPLAALVKAWQTTMLATMLLVGALTLSRIWDGAVYLRELPVAFQTIATDGFLC